MLFKKKEKKKDRSIREFSNIIQFDDMGYPLLLCIDGEGDQVWIDVNKDWAHSGIEAGILHLLKWKVCGR